MKKTLPIQAQQFIASFDFDHKGKKFSVYCQTRHCGVRKIAGELQKRSWKESKTRNLLKIVEMKRLCSWRWCTVLSVIQYKRKWLWQIGCKNITNNILFLFSCGIKCIAGSGDLKGSTLGEICRKTWLRDVSNLLKKI